jgi:hypothetical protein
MFALLSRLDFRAVLFLAAACTPLEGPDPVTVAKRRASFELSCPTSQLHAYWLDDDGTTLGVRGCGAKLVYVKACNRAGCEWLLNSNVKHREEEEE